MANDKKDNPSAQYAALQGTINDTSLSYQAEVKELSNWFSFWKCDFDEIEVDSSLNKDELLRVHVIIFMRTACAILLEECSPRDEEMLFFNALNQVSSLLRYEKNESKPTTDFIQPFLDFKSQWNQFSSVENYLKEDSVMVNAPDFGKSLGRFWNENDTVKKYVQTVDKVSENWPDEAEDEEV